MTVEPGPSESPAPAEGGAAAPRQVLSFRLADEEYAVDILRVQELKCWERVTRIPRTPPYLKGVINLRGEIVPVIDLRERLGLPPLAPTPHTVLVILKTGNATKTVVVGAIVDSVCDVYPLEEGDIHAPPSLGGTMDDRFLLGLATTGEGTLMLLDEERLLDLGAP